MSIFLLGTNQSPKLPTGFLNSVNGDPAPGLPVSTTGVSGSIIQPYLGQVGGKLSLDTTEASGMSDPATATLLAGVYMYVQFLVSSVAANVRGQIVFWSSRATYVVTPDVTAATSGLVAGVTLSAITKGNFGWIQIAGRANVKYKGALTAVAPVAGDLVIVDQAPSNLVDDPTQSTALTPAQTKGILGTAVVLPVAAATSAVDLAFFETGWGY